MSKLAELRRRMRADGPYALVEAAQFALELLDREAHHALERFQFGQLGAHSAVLRPARLRNTRFVRIGAHVMIRDGARIEAIRHHAGQTFTPTIDIGDRVFAEYRLQIESAQSVSIGADTLIAGDVFISDLNHGFGEGGVHPLATPLTARPVSIGPGCWIGQRACILPGVTLGAGCVVAAGAVVTASFPERSVIGGIPARIIPRATAGPEQTP